MVIGMWLRAKNDTTMTKLRSAGTTLTGATGSLLLIWLFISARYLSTSLGRSIALTAIHQLRGDNLMKNCHIGGDSKHLLAQFELLYGLTGLVINCSRRHFGYLITCFFTISNPPLAPGTDPFTRSRFRSGSASITCNFIAVTRAWPICPAMRVPFRTRPGVVPEPMEPGARVRSD